MRPTLHGKRAALAALIAVVALATVAIAPAAAIRYGGLDNNDHPYVGLMVALDASGNPLWRCTGTLLSDTVFLTAGHCVEAPAAHVEVWFSAGPEPLGAGYPAAGPDRCAGITGYPCTGDAGGDPHQNPNWNPAAFYLHDVGIVTFDEPYDYAGPFGLLPDENQLDQLHNGRHTWFTAVGYGLQAAFPDAASWKDVQVRERRVGNPWLYQINTNFAGPRDLILSDNAAAGGTCFGDSGGPNFLGSSRVIAGVNSFVYNSQCAGFSGAYRVDRGAAFGGELEWIEGFLD
jgi:hypothetical protein